MVERLTTMINETALKIIQNSGGLLTRPIRLVVFIKDTGCPTVVELAQTIKGQLGKIVLEIYDMVMDRDKAEQYDIKRVPALVVQGGDGEMVTFYGLMENVSLDVLLNAIHAVSERKIWFPEDIRRSLGRLVNDVKIRVFIENNSLPCKFVADTAIGLALASDRIDTDIIVAGDFPELAKKYNVTTLPKTIFGENLHVDGNMLESECLEMIFQAEGIKPGPDRKCLVCGKASQETICSNCKTRIQAEAFKHKLESERQKQPDTR
jgi:predicted nucleic acid-binding Zn ribbon protein